jgi:hypothetical protein
MARTRWVRLCCLSGLLGSFLFLSGDMLFYGTLSSGAAFHPYLEMAHRPLVQLVIGGALGPIAALFSAIGVGLFYVALEPGSRPLAYAVGVLLAVMMLIGGAYHAVYTVFGFASKVADESVRETLITQVTSLRDTISYPMYATGIAGTALTYFLGLWKKTQFPRWLLVFLPTSLSMASSAVPGYFLAIPAPFGGIISGGWINGSFLLFFAIATCVFWHSETSRVQKSPSSN